MFVLPLIMFCWEQEMKLSFEKNEGPYGENFQVAGFFKGGWLAKRNVFKTTKEKRGKN